MARIHLLDQAVIDKIAAGEVVERPGSIVKELCENAIDAGASALTVEIRDGGVSLIRVTDNGDGLAPDQIRTAFLRHATSKITEVEGLTTIRSFGFRGEALSSISAVSRVELITKTRENLTGIRYKVDGGAEILYEEIGAPEGSTFLVRDLFYNTPARKKFLKSAQTEAGYISDFVSRLALSHPEISVKFMVNGTTKLSTSGSGSQKDVIYSVFGRDITANLIEVERTDEAQEMTRRGWIGKPQISRGNRTCEIFYVNGRLIYNNIMSKAVEEGYETFLMQHKFPFVILSLDLPGTKVDVNVHPAKAQVRFSEGPAVFDFVKDAVKDTLTHRELIIDTTFGTVKEEEAQKKEALKRALEAEAKTSVPEPFEKLRREHQAQNESGSGTQSYKGGVSPYARQYPNADRQRAESAERIRQSNQFLKEVSQLSIFDDDFGSGSQPGSANPSQDTEQPCASVPGLDTVHENISYTAEKQTGEEGDAGGRLSQAKFLTPEHLKEHRLIGQVFDTYWIVEFQDHMYIIDQHAAHEKVMFERLMRKYRNKQASSQMISPSLILSLTMAEEDLLTSNMEYFREIGFEIEPFGGHDYAISAVPQDLFGLTEREFFMEMLDSLSTDTGKQSIENLTARVATMACKAAVKGNTRLSVQEADALISELLTLDNPYNCPHGRPTILSMSRTEIEKKFHRIV